MNSQKPRGYLLRSRKLVPQQFHCISKGANCGLFLLINMLIPTLVLQHNPVGFNQTHIKTHKARVISLKGGRKTDKKVNNVIQ